MVSCVVLHASNESAEMTMQQYPCLCVVSVCFAGMGLAKEAI